MKKNMGRLLFHEEPVYEIQRPEHAQFQRC